MKSFIVQLLLATGALAANQITTANELPLSHSGFSLNPGFGFYNFDAEVNAADVSFPSLGLEYRFLNNSAIEITYIDAETNRKDRPNENFDMHIYHLNALYYFKDGRQLQPYVFAGAGERDFNYSNGTSSIVDTFLNIGAGIHYSFTSIFSIRGDVKALSSLDYETTAVATTVRLAWQLGKSKQRNELSINRADYDGDGISNALDQCLNTPIKILVVDSTGCPLDQDKDGIGDYMDLCSDTGTDIPVDSVGCPLDLDQDGIADFEDKCPETKKHHRVDKGGCSLMLTEPVSMTLNVKFPGGSAELPQEQLKEVEKLAIFMTRHSEATATIEGHSDSRGDSSFNQFISQSRADHVRTLLINHFHIGEERLKAMGYGEDSPIASNDTLEGRRKNRRVVAVIHTTVEKEQP
ncbi:MAG: OmpA family protein [Pseudomonadales bacterium]|nr:OmpA family protein [Pseudomonadales bacterium]